MGWVMFPTSQMASTSMFKTKKKNIAWSQHSQGRLFPQELTTFSEMYTIFFFIFPKIFRMKKGWSLLRRDWWFAIFIKLRIKSIVNRSSCQWLKYHSSNIRNMNNSSTLKTKAKYPNFYWKIKNLGNNSSFWDRRWPSCKGKL